MPAPKAKSIAVAVAVAISALSSTSGAAPQQIAQQAAPAPATQQRPSMPRCTDDSPPVCDPQITHALYRGGHNDIERAKLALQKSQNQDVRAFATGVLRDITPIDNDVVNLEQKLQIHPQDSALESSTEQEARNAHERLMGLSGKEFDKAYAENEVAFYRKISSALRDMLIPNAQNPEIKNLMQSAAAIYQRKQQEAEQLASKVGVVG